MDAPDESRLFLTTQPGWAFATLAELRLRGVGGYVPFAHRDSSLVAPLPGGEGDLLTPADVWGLLLAAEGGRRDATVELDGAVRRAVASGALRRHLSRWAEADARLRYSVGSEVWGETALHRAVLRDVVGEAVARACPRWRPGPSGGVRVFLKADARVALLGVRLATNLDAEDASAPMGRPGTLREHLACALLVLAGLAPGGAGVAGDGGWGEGAVLDPFMGTGTVLRAAARHFGVRTCLGYEVDGAAVERARARVRAPQTRLVHDSFTACRPERLPAGTRLVSNLPFGARFRPVPTRALVPFLDRCLRRVEGMALLMGREQGAEVAGALALERKNVLVLGQPASIVSSERPGGL